MNECVNESASESAPAYVPEAWSGWFELMNEPTNDALALLHGLALGLTAPHRTGLNKIAEMVAEFFNQSRLTTEDLATLKAAAIVIVRCRKHN